MSFDCRYGNVRAVGGEQRNWPRSISRKAVRIVDDGDRIAQFWFGVEKEGNDSVRSGNSGGFESNSWLFDGFEEGCRR